MAGPTERVLQLLSLLQTHQHWRGSDLATRLGVSERTVRRDVDRLRTLGYPVDALPGVEGGYRLAAGAHLPPLLLDDDEAVAVAVGLRSATAGGLPGIDDTVLRVLLKLEQVLPDRLRRRVRALVTNTAVLTWGTPAASLDADALATLAQACRDHEEVRFAYRSRDGADSDRLVQPHQLVVSGRTWYLVCWDCRRDDWRTFRVDRLHDVRLAGVRFTPRTIPGDDAAAFVARSIRSASRARTTTVLVDAPLPVVATEQPWLADAAVAVDAAHCRVTVRGEQLDWVLANVCALASRYPVHVEDDPEVTAALGALSRRLASAAAG